MFGSDNLLNQKILNDWVTKKLGNRKLDLIVGISMGGFLIPELAKELPFSKLIFIASGARFAPEVKRLKSVVGFVQTKPGMSIARLLINIPTVLFEFVYKIFDPFSGDESQHQNYIDDMRLNLVAIKNIPVKKHAEIAKIVTQTDNRELLKNLNNSSLILSGKKDLLMPVVQGRELQNCLKNSKLVIIDSIHFNVLNDTALGEIGKFLK